MPIEYPVYTEILDRDRADLAAALPGVDPTIFGSFSRALADTTGSRSYDVILLLQQLQDQLFPQTALDEFLDLWASYETITRNAADDANGDIVITGTVSSSIPVNTTFTSVIGNIYIVQSTVTITAQSIGITSLTRSGSTVTATTSAAHNLASNIEGTIAGAVETDYNVTATITILSETTFTYEITTTPTTPATGTVTFSFDGAFASVESQEFGLDQNLESGAQLNITSPISGVDATAYVQYAGITGGLDEESNERLLVRVLQSRASPVANFNVAAIEKVALAVTGVTRVKVKRITPDTGSVTILFVRDDDDSIIPDAAEILEVRTAILVILQASSDEADVVTPTLTPVTTDYNFSSISPDTDTMRTAIQNNLEAFYEDKVDFETTITEESYKAAIIGTVDTDTGDQLTAFTLSSPSTDITVTTNEIGVLGDLIF